jgi:hypothetical protein
MRGAVCYVTVDFSVTEHARVTGELTKGLEDLTFNVGRDLAQRQELRYVSKTAGELQEKVDNLLQMLPCERRVKRGMLSLGGKALKFFFRSSP